VTRDFSTIPDEGPPRPHILERIRLLPTGTKLLAASGFLLFFSLFLTWQNLQVVYQGAGVATTMLDGWDFWGLLIGFLTFGLVVLALLLNGSDIEFSNDVRWDLVVLGGAVAIFLLVLLKNLTDDDSAWASYLGLALAALVVAGAYLDWSSERSARSVRRRRRRWLSSGA
jgi:hypothetical protein